MAHEGWSDEQREALERWSEKDPSDRHPRDLIPGDDEPTTNSGSPEVTDEECASMRRRFKASDDITIRGMSESGEFSYGRNTIARHVFNREDCSHDIDEEPAEEQIDQRPKDEQVQPGECAEMRKSFQDGLTVVQVKEEFEMTYDQTYYHIVGRCKCDNDVEPAESGQQE